MKKLLLVLMVLVLVLTAAGPVLGATSTGTEDAALPFPDIPRLTKEQVKAMLGKPGVVLLDCRPDEQWRFSDQKLPGATHEDPMNVESWAEKYSKDATMIIY